MHMEEVSARLGFTVLGACGFWVALEGVLGFRA